MTDPSIHILVVDDEQQLLSLISYALQSEGFHVETATTGAEAFNVLDEHAVDLIVLDVMLPDINGVELCRKIRLHTDCPIVFLTARSDQADVIAGLEAGGDDYLAKPFSVEELLLRINAMLRRSSHQKREVFVGSLTIRLDSHDVTVNEISLDLSPLEFRFLKYLASNRTRVVSTTELVEEVWGVADLGAHDPIVKSVVYRLRQKLGPPDRTRAEIRNVRGVGYQLRSVQ